MILARRGAPCTSACPRRRPGEEPRESRNGELVALALTSSPGLRNLGSTDVTVRDAARSSTDATEVHAPRARRLPTGVHGARPTVNEKLAQQAAAHRAIHEREKREARLAEVDDLLSGGADSIALVFERAHLLDELGHTPAARDAYLEVLTRNSTHAGALNELGRLLDRTGFHAAARTAFTRAVDAHPDDAIGHGNLATSLLDGGDAKAAQRHYEIAVTLDPHNVPAHQCLAILLLRQGDEERAAAHGRIGFRQGASRWPYRGDGVPIEVLVLHSALGGNVPIDRFIDDRTFAKSTLVAEFYDPQLPLPPHAFVVNAIGDASRCTLALRAAQRIAAATSASIVNAPARIAATARTRTAGVLAGLGGVIAPRTVSMKREDLLGPRAAEIIAAAGFTWPIIVRTPGFQTGQHCVLIETPQRLAGAVASLPGNELQVIAFVDVRGADGKVRKYRVMLVDGAILPLHLAISTHWMVHYFRTDMAERPEHQAEEAEFLADMPGVVGASAGSAIAAIADRLGLDYGGIDFSFDERGNVVVFEANATMIVPESTAERRAYRRAAIEQVEAAVRAMLLSQAAHHRDPAGNGGSVDRVQVRR